MFPKDDMYRLVKEIQNAFRAGNRKFAIRLTKQLESEHIAPLQVLQQAYTNAGRTQFETFAYLDTFMQGETSCCDS